MHGGLYERKISPGQKKSPPREGRADLEAIVDRIRHYCASREHCVQEVNLKLVQWKVSPEKRRKILRTLMEEGYINEDRYARLYVRSKFHINKWGRVKIRYELRNRLLADSIIDKALEEIGEDDYHRTIQELIQRKWSEIKSEKTLNIREKIINFVTGKGFEIYLITQIITELNI
ncbi:MAG TPA: regulatory protein RecX [Bacteroidales bacterium]|nr:regulatory protein RecX [Bacteroidales bacterium]HPS61692.1 regulatory protein RecX [Bacteroidales bacterium]